MGMELQEDKKARGIWKYKAYYPSVEEKYQLSLGEGQTPQVEIEGVIFKREDENPTGSLKDRGIAYQISYLSQTHTRDLVISTSGNAGISAAAYCQLAHINLYVFASRKINHGKLSKIRELGAKDFVVARPVSEAVRFSKEKDFLNLRSSLLPEAIEGYQSLAFEIHKSNGPVDDLFIPVSSGAALVGTAKGYKALGYLPCLHVVQTTAICPIARLFDKNFKETKSSLAEALVARVTSRKNEIMQLVRESEGSGWVISDAEILKAWDWLKNYGLDTSAEGAAALAAIWKARNKNLKLGKKVVCLLTGRNYAI